MANYYIYVDDSAKFYNENDTHVFYSYVLLDKKTRDIFNEKFVEANRAIRFLGKNLKTYQKKDIGEWSSTLFEKNKGNQIYKKYNAILKSGNQTILKRYEIFLDLHKYSISFGVVCWCKKEVKKSKKDTWSKGEQDIYGLKRKRYLLLMIISKLVEEKKIKSNKELNVFIDVESDDGVSNEIKANDIKHYLNLKARKRQPKVFENKLQALLRKEKIKINKVEFIDSKISFPIQYADLIANFANKMINKGKNISEVYDFFFQQKLIINCLIYPSFKLINVANNQKCC